MFNHETNCEILEFSALNDKTFLEQIRKSEYLYDKKDILDKNDE
jgi:hypothetical protein